MCQMSVVLDHDGQQEKVMENVTLLEVVPEGVRISTLFEEPKIVAGRVQRIDFMAGTVTLAGLEIDRG